MTTLGRLLRRSDNKTAYQAAVRAVLGASERRRATDALAVRWAHEIAWAEHPCGDEAVTLAETAAVYGVDVAAMHEERAQELPPVVPAMRRRREDHPQTRTA